MTFLHGQHTHCRHRWASESRSYNPASARQCITETLHCPRCSLTAVVRMDGGTALLDAMQAPEGWSPEMLVPGIDVVRYGYPGDPP